jgi:anti-sigma B factor antagonist
MVNNPPSDTKEFKVKDIEGGTEVCVECNLDRFNCSKLRSQVISLIAQGKRNIVISLAGAEYIDSSGLGVLVFLSNLLKRHSRTLKLTALQPTAMAVIKAVHLDEMWEIYESPDR